MWKFKIWLRNRSASSVEEDEIQVWRNLFCMCAGFGGRKSKLNVMDVYYVDAIPGN